MATTECEDLWNILESFNDGEKCKDASLKEYDRLKAFCKSCQCAEHIILIEGNVSCTKCGALIDRFIDSGAEWRYFGHDDGKADTTRCGLPASELLPESSMGALIGYTCRETQEMRIMRRYHMWNSMSYKERTLYNIFDTLTTTAVNNGINKSIIDEAKMLYKKISELKISRGENRNGLIASSIYMACKRNKVPRSAKEIAAIFNLKATTMTRGCKRFQEMLRMNMDATGPVDFIARFCSKLNMDPAMKDFCKRVVLKAEEISLNYENTPPSIAAGAILLCSDVCDWGITRAMLAEVCDISPVTIFKCSCRLREFKDLLMPEGIAFPSGSVSGAEKN